jgi:hypothetical protein
MTNQFTTNYAIPSATNIFKCLWKLTRVMKAAGWNTMASCNGTTIDSSGTQANDLWGGNANPQADAYSNVSTYAATGQSSANISSNGTLTVSSTTNFPASGTLYIATSLGWQNVTYTGISGSTFTSCNGGTGNPTFGSVVSGSTTMGLDQVSAWIVLSGPTTIRVPLTSAPTGTFLRNENVTQSGSGATGSIFGYVWDSVGSSGWAVISPQTGTFNNTGTITGATSGATLSPPGTVTTAIGAGQTASNISGGGTLTVTSTTGFPTSGTITVSTSLGWQNVAYTNTSGSTFTGCTGGTGIPISGNLVASGSFVQGTLVATYVREFLFFKDTGQVNVTVFYICADKVGEITQLFSTLAGYTGHGGAGRAATTTNSGSGALSSFTTLIVNSVSGFPSSGSINVMTSTGQETVSYTGTQTSPSIAFTGCSGGGSGNIVNGSYVSNVGVAPGEAPAALGSGVGPGMGGLNNSLNTISPKGICLRGTAGSNTATTLFGIGTNFQTNAQMACVNATPSAGVSADGSFYLVLTNTNTANTACLIQFTSLDDSEPGDVDPYVYFGPNSITFSSWLNSATTSYYGQVYVAPVHFAGTNFSNPVTSGSFFGYQSRGNSVITRDVPCSYAGVETYNDIGLWLGSVTGSGLSNPIRICNTPATSRPLAREPLTIYTVIPLGVTNAVGQVKGKARWMTTMGVGNVYDTSDSKTWICVCNAVNVSSPSLFIGPFDGVTTPIM